MSKQDQLYRYLFENHAVRGELVNLPQTYQQIIANHQYPRPVQHLLGELLVATSLLTALLKFDGDITVQLQGDGPLSLAVINGNNHQQMRGVARIQGEIPLDSNLHQMIGNGYLVITIMPKDGERYQGVVGLDGETLAECLKGYFRQSEQLDTRLFIKVNDSDAAGMLLQVLPAEEREDNAFEHLVTLTETVKAQELFELPAEEVLHRLYHQEEVRLFESQPVSFKCNCSRERCADALMAVSPAELEEILNEDGQIDMHCDYCNSHYLFDKVDIEAARHQVRNVAAAIEKH